MTTQPASSSSPSKPSSPPPAYTEVDLAQSQPRQPSPMSPPSGPSSPYIVRSGGPSLPYVVHPGYGPTPIAHHQTVLLPYYDPRSPHALAEADRRARWRFISAFFWALVILFFISAVTGSGVEAGIHHRVRRWSRVNGGSEDWQEW